MTPPLPSPPLRSFRRFRKHDKQALLKPDAAVRRNTYGGGQGNPSSSSFPTAGFHVTEGEGDPLSLPPLQVRCLVLFWLLLAPAALGHKSQEVRESIVVGKKKKQSPGGLNVTPKDQTMPQTHTQARGTAQREMSGDDSATCVYEFVCSKQALFFSFYSRRFAPKPASPLCM